MNSEMQQSPREFGLELRVATLEETKALYESTKLPLVVDTPQEEFDFFDEMGMNFTDSAHGIVMDVIDRIATVNYGEGQVMKVVSSGKNEGFRRILTTEDGMTIDIDSEIEKALAAKKENNLT